MASTRSEKKKWLTDHRNNGISMSMKMIMFEGSGWSHTLPLILMAKLLGVIDL
jgi:hypothetical protein